MNILKRYVLPVATALIFVAFAWWQLIVLNSDVLYLAQDMSYWQPGILFFDQCLAEPGGIFSWAGCFLTQFFHYPAVGVTLLIVQWLAIYVLLTKGCRMPWWLTPLGIAVPVMLLMPLTSLGYEIYIHKVPDFWFAPTLLVLTASVVIFLCRWFGRWLRLVLQVAVCVAVVAYGQTWINQTHVNDEEYARYRASADDERYHAEIRMARAVEECRWNDVLADMRQCKAAPTRSMWIFKNVALLNKDRLHIDWLNYQPMTEIPTVSSDSAVLSLSDSFAPLIYYTHGSLGFSCRWTIEQMVECGPSAQRLRMLARCAIVMGEDDLARRYLDLLSRMIFQKDWAKEQYQYIGHPELLAAAPAYRVPHEIYGLRRDLLDADGGRVEKYLIEIYSKELQGKSDTYAKLCMMYALQSQDIPSFWRQLYAHIYINGDKPLPRLYQEAAWLYINLEPASADVSSLHIDDDVKAAHKRFIAATSRLIQQGLSESEVATMTYREYGHSFFWFYFFCRGIYLY
ncbi:MAG: hypothetical protein KBT20_10875 [Bacteroidales bacterium]|nr:hypothetical protein [Candidatus Liminaster caballi]